MKKVLMGFVLTVLIEVNVFAQTGTSDDFNDNVLTGWTGNGSIYVLTETNQELNVAASVTANSYSIFSYDFASTLDLSSSPYVTVKIKSSANVRVRIDLIDATGKVTNAAPLNPTIIGNNTYQTITYNYTGRFSQSWPSTSTVDATQIEGFMVFINPGGAAFTGTVFMDDVLVGSNTGILPPPGDVKLNQLGFYPNAVKTAVVVTGSVSPFYIVSFDKQDTVYTGTLGTPASFSMTGESISKAVFTDFDSVGYYFLAIPGIGYSNPFEIRPDVHHAVSKAGLKGMYYQRASMPLLSTHAGIWARSAGHLDNNVLVHNSAASTLRPANSTISSRGGWYDAGDYNKYIVTAGLSTSMLLSMYEHYPSYFDTLDLNIPESANTIPDVLDEALYEIRWMLTMQDPSDGGVYCKLTSPNFDGNIMPSAASQPRYVVQKTTAATLDFAATMAQTARVVKLFETELPGLADSCILAAKKAWLWSKANPSIQYVQSLLSSPAINTGEYGDGNFADEFQWAAMELYGTTLDDSYYTEIGILANISPPTWANVRALGYMSLAHLRKRLTSIADTTGIKQRIIGQAEFLKTRGNLNPYGTAMYESYNFNWGSNGTAAMQGVLLLHAFDITKDSSYLRLAIANLDYVLGRNGANYCFVTGYGTVSPMDIHHRIVVADGISESIPGLLAGGPNIDAQNDCGGASNYPSSYPGSSYLDAYCSYSTNEIAINWNTPFAFLSNVIEAIESGAASEHLNYEVVNSIQNAESKSRVTAIGVFPNPVKDKLTVTYTLQNGEMDIEFTDLRGIPCYQRHVEGNGEQEEIINVSNLPNGMYYLLFNPDSALENIC